MDYCVYLTTYKGNKLPPFYIGSVHKSKLMNGYRGSVSSNEYGVVWRRELADNPHLFSTKIICTRSTAREATERERFFHQKLDVVSSPLYVNKSIATPSRKVLGTSDAYKLFMRKLQRERKRLGVTQVELADKLKIPQSLVSKIERGARRMDIFEFCAWCAAIGTSASDFLKPIQDHQFELSPPSVAVHTHASRVP